MAVEVPLPAGLVTLVTTVAGAELTGVGTAVVDRAVLVLAMTTGAEEEAEAAAETEAEAEAEGVAETEAADRVTVAVPALETRVVVPELESLAVMWNGLEYWKSAALDSDLMTRP